MTTSSDGSRAFTNQSEAADAGLNLTLKDPLESWVYRGLYRQIRQVFGFNGAWLQSTDRQAALRKISGNTAGQADQPMSVKYPIFLLTLQSVGEDTERGNTRAMSRRGFPVSIKEGTKNYFYVRVLPVIQRVQLEFIAQNYADLSNFTALLLHARRSGWLNFNVQFGRSSFSITVRPDGEVTIPQREGSATELKEYALQIGLEVRGFVSVPTLSEQTIISSVVIEAALTDDADAAAAGNTTGAEATFVSDEVGGAEQVGQASSVTRSTPD
jgi:hypothetical protein